jgi:HlyD family secretion protein
MMMPFTRGRIVAIARPARAIVFGVMALLGCQKPEPAPVYQLVPVARRDIVVSVQASGTLAADTIVEVKSKASGEVLDMKVQTGQLVKRDTVMVLIDPRLARNAVAEAQADLDVATARLATSTAQKNRADELFKSRSITEQEHEQALLSFADASAAVVKTRVALESAQIQLEGTEVRAPITGTIIEKNVERGQLIVSATTNVSGGSVLFSMADLSLVQVITPVDETDIAKVQPGMNATVLVDAYPRRPFQGTVLKIEPQADTGRSVTRFPVRVRIENREKMLRPGMTAEVEFHVGRADSVLAVPNAALRTSGDMGSAAEVLGLDSQLVQKQLTDRAQRESDSAAGRTFSAESAQLGARTSGNSQGLTLPGGRTAQLPPGVTEAQVRSIMAKHRAGQRPTASERAIMQQVLRGTRGAGGGGTGGQSRGRQSGGRYVVFVKRAGQPVAVSVKTGLTDLDYSEVLGGLEAGDSVYLLPSASLVQSQQRMQERSSRSAGGLPGIRRSESSGARPMPEGR